MAFGISVPWPGGLNPGPWQWKCRVLTTTLPGTSLAIINFKKKNCYCSVTKSCLTLCNPIDCSTPGFPVRHHLLEFAQTLLIEPVMLSNHLIVCYPLLLLSSVFPRIRVFSNESALCIMWPKYWNFSFNIISSNEYSGLISFSTDWFDLLAVQGTLNSLLQHHSSKV